MSLLKKQRVDTNVEFDQDRLMEISLNNGPLDIQERNRTNRLERITGVTGPIESDTHFTPYFFVPTHFTPRHSSTPHIFHPN